MHRAVTRTGHRRRGALAATLATVLALGAVPAIASAADGSPASAAPTPAAAPGPASLTVLATQQTGTAPFDGDDAAGHDSGADNGIVRTNDTVSYELSIRYAGEDHTKPTVRFTVPRGQSLLQLPPFCLAGSSVTPASLPAPATPLTATSWESLPAQEVVCVLKDETAGTALNYPFVTQLRSEVPNGTQMDPVVFRISSEQATTPVETAPLRQTASAASRLDLSKRVSATNPNSGPLFQSDGACPAPYANEACRRIAYPVSITVPAGGKGMAPLSGPISFTDELDPAGFYGATVWAQMVAAAGSEADAKARYAPAFSHCSPITAGSGFRGSLPYSSLSQGAPANETNSVRHSGTLDCPTTGRGEPGTITVTGADTSGFTTPTTTGGGSSLEANVGYIVTFELSVAVPMAALLDFGGSGQGDFTLTMTNRYEHLTATSLDGTPVTETNLENNDRSASIRVQAGGSIDKLFTGIPGEADDNVPAGTFMQGDAVWLPGPPGSGVKKDGNTVVMPGQALYSVLRMAIQGPPGTGTQYSSTIVGCDAWDGDRLALAAHPDWNGYDAAGYPGNGRPVFPVLVRHPYYNVPASGIGSDASGIRGYRVEYSTGPAGADFDCSTGSWAENPDDIVAPTTDAQGRTVWNGINRVRVTWESVFPAGTVFGDTTFALAIGQVVRDGDAAVPMGNWASMAYASGSRSAAEVLADANATRFASSYDPATHKGAQGDRLWQGEARVRVQKLVENLGTGEFTSAAVPQYTSGTTARYRLDPTLSTSVPVAGNTTPVVIEDCLPRYQVFQSAAQGGAALNPTLQQQGAPAGAEIACSAERQYLRWELGSLPVGAPIEPIVVTAEILETAPNGVYKNEAVVSSPSDGSPLAQRSSSVQMQLVVPTGLKISKIVDKPVVEVNPADVTTPRILKWSVFFANVDGPPNVGNLDLIDVLPADGLNGSAFAGTLRFDAATVAAGTGIAIRYTKAAPAALHSEPSDASNLAAGSTVWCDAASGGAVVSGTGTAADCPQSPAEVTGLRFQRPGSFLPSDAFQVDIAMTPVGNRSGDEYANIASGRADGVTQGVGPARRVAKVIASQIGDRVWFDVNGNGIQDPGEPGAGNVPVTLTGTDADGNTVSRTTTTDVNGNYLFAELASGNYAVAWDISGYPGYVFTQKGAGNDSAKDSDANPATGATDQFALLRDTSDLTRDAGLVQRTGGLVINKQLRGAGVNTIAASDTLEFGVVCTYHGAKVFERTVTLPVNGQSAVTSGELGPIPAAAECVVTETGAGSADKDALPAPVTVTIPWDPQALTSGVVTASLTNWYSAGQLRLTKHLEGDREILDKVRDREFSFLVTCQIQEQNSGGTTVVTDLFSKTWTIKGGETIIISVDGVTPYALPVGSHCFGKEIDDLGATAATIDRDSFQNAAIVTAGTPETLQILQITARNVFACTPESCPPPIPSPTPTATPTATPSPEPTASPTPQAAPLASTGAQAAPAVGIALALLLFGALLLRRRRPAKE